MAEGYARASGKPGVVLVTSGPGATNVITPMQDALSDGTPLVVFCGQVVTGAIGSDAFQEADVVGISRACTVRTFGRLSFPLGIKIDDISCLTLLSNADSKSCVEMEYHGQERRRASKKNQ